MLDFLFFFQAEDGIRDSSTSRGLGDVYKRQDLNSESLDLIKKYPPDVTLIYSKRSAESFDQIVSKYSLSELMTQCTVMCLSLIHI